MTLKGQHFDRENNVPLDQESPEEGEDDALSITISSHRTKPRKHQSKQPQLLEYWKETISFTLSSFLVCCMMNQVLPLSLSSPPLLRLIPLSN
jgi:hypothetical protein